MLCKAFWGTVTDIDWFASLHCRERTARIITKRSLGCVLTPLLLHPSSTLQQSVSAVSPWSWSPSFGPKPHRPQQALLPCAEAPGLRRRRPPWRCCWWSCKDFGGVGVGMCGVKLTQISQVSSLVQPDRSGPSQSSWSGLRTRGTGKSLDPPGGRRTFVQFGEGQLFCELCRMFCHVLLIPICSKFQPPTTQFCFLTSLKRTEIRPETYQRCNSP